MDRASHYNGSFSAAHAQGEPHRDAATTRLHGHDFSVWVKAECAHSAAIQMDLNAIASELNGRQLEEMMPGSSTDASSIASWFMERLITKYPPITEVSVVAAGHNDMVIREKYRAR